MQIRFDEYYIFCSKTKPKIFLYKVECSVDSSKYGFISSGRVWKKVTIEQFNDLGVTFIGKYKR
jgi:hypothetical protein